jgi:hypothetical protein
MKLLTLLMYIFLIEGPPGMGYAPSGSVHYDGNQGRDGLLQSPVSEDGSYSRQGPEKHYDHHGRATSSASTKVKRQYSHPHLLPPPGEGSSEGRTPHDLVPGASSRDPKLIDLVYKLTSGKINNLEAISQITKIVATQPSSHPVSQAATIPAQEPVRLPRSEPSVAQHDIDLREPPKPTRVTSMTEEFPDDALEFDMPRRNVLRKFAIRNAFKAEGRVQDKRNFELVRSGGNISGGSRLSYQVFVPLYVPYVPSRDGPPPGANKVSLSPLGVPKEPWGTQVSGKQIARDPRFRQSLGTGSEVPVGGSMQPVVASTAGATGLTTAVHPPVARLHSTGTSQSLGNLLSEDVLPTATLTSILQKFNPGQLKPDTSSALGLQDKSGGSSPVDDAALAEMDLYSMGPNSGSSSPNEMLCLEEEIEENTTPPKPQTGFYSTYTPSDIEKHLSSLNSPKTQNITTSLPSPYSSNKALQQAATSSAGTSDPGSTAPDEPEISDTTGSRSASDLAKSLLQKLHIPVVSTPCAEAVKPADVSSALVTQSSDTAEPPQVAVQPLPVVTPSSGTREEHVGEDETREDKSTEKSIAVVPVDDFDEMDDDTPIKSVDIMKSFLNEDVDKTEKLALPLKSG